MKKTNDLKISTYTGFQFTPEEYIIWLNNISNKDKILEIKNLSLIINIRANMLKTIYMSLFIFTGGAFLIIS